MSEWDALVCVVVGAGLLCWSGEGGVSYGPQKARQSWPAVEIFALRVYVVAPVWQAWPGAGVEPVVMGEPFYPGARSGIVRRNDGTAVDAESNRRVVG